MRRALAIAKLTFQEGLRLRIVLALLVVLVLLLLYLPFTLRGDETLAGRLQNFLAYSLGALSFLLSLATIFFSCATLTNEFRERSLHLLVTKPVTRLEILLGKWLGVNALNVVILAVGGAVIFGFAAFIRSLPVEFERDRFKVRDVVWTARHAATPVVPPDIADLARREVAERIRAGALSAAQRAAAEREQFEQILNRWRSVPPGVLALYEFTNLAPPERADTKMQVRYKLRATPSTANEMVRVGWVFCDPDTKQWLHEPVFAEERAGQRHEFLVTAEPVLAGGRAVLGVLNPYPPEMPITLFFEGPDSLQVLYKVGSFEANYLRALLIIGLRLALLSAVGVCFSVFVSFPVACLCVSAFYLICLGLPFWLEAIGEGAQYLSPKDDPYGRLGPAVRAVLVRLLLVAFPDFSRHDGVGPLIDGEYIGAPLLLQTVARTLGYGLVLVLVGWLVFRRREVAEITV